MYLYVHSSTVHNSHNTEATEMSIDRWMEKEDVVHASDGTLLSRKKKEIMPFAATQTQPKIIILKWSKSERERHILYHLYVESKIWHK